MKCRAHCAWAWRGVHVARTGAVRLLVLLFSRSSRDLSRWQRHSLHVGRVRRSPDLEGDDQVQAGSQQAPILPCGLAAQVAGRLRTRDTHPPSELARKVSSASLASACVRLPASSHMVGHPVVKNSLIPYSAPPKCSHRTQAADVLSKELRFYAILARRRAHTAGAPSGPFTSGGPGGDHARCPTTFRPSKRGAGRRRAAPAPPARQHQRCHHHRRPHHAMNE